MEPFDVRIAGFVRSLIKGCIPLVLACLVLYLMGLDPDPTGPVIIGALLIAAVVLWFGWRYVRANVVTTCLGLLLGILVGSALLIFVIAMGLRMALYLFILFLIAMPLLVYDLFIRAPHQGRFMRAREERRRMHSTTQPLD